MLVKWRDFKAQASNIKNNAAKSRIGILEIKK
jgi:hypothetical protein